MHKRILEIAELIGRLEDQRRSLAERVRRSGIEVLPDALERGCTLAVRRSPFTGMVVAVDGGLLAREFYGFDLMMTRAVGVVYEYRSSKRTGHEYYPSPFPEPDYDATSTLDTHEFQWYKALFRLRKEISIALECAERYRPDLLLLDGSIAPQVSDKPSEGSEPRALYEQVLKYYERLYSACAQNGVQLVGVVKDSRGKRFLEMLEKSLGEAERDVLSRSNDTSILHFLLREGERTPAFSYASSSKEHQVLRDLREWSSHICAFYLKPTEEDRPLRIEFLNSNADIDCIASTLSELSSINRKYAYPAVLIEADMRAAMHPLELERAYKDLFVRTGMRAAMMRLRRDNRPFR